MRRLRAMASKPQEMGRVSLFTLLLVYTWFLCVFEAQARRRNLTEITYQFTNCGSTNHDGPRVESQCRPLYEEMDSPIVAKPTTLFRFEDGIYDGAQGFRIPRDDIYNITVGGARGGEGVCNFHYGRGGVLSAQVRLTTDYEYLILVGHRGSSVCDLPQNTDHPVCQLQRPTNLAEAQVCNQSWFNWTQTLDTPAIQDNSYTFNGGGGGGGASMVWPRRVDNKTFTDMPIMIAPGGGGASAVLDYDGLVRGIKAINISFPNTDDAEALYRFHIDAHLDQYFLTWPMGSRGSRARGEVITSGSGGGWTSTLLLPQLLSVDGKLLSQVSDFAEGGFDCSSSLTSFASHVFTNVFGGYGGGGGGCGSGGGGGGYTGGHVITYFNYISGSGGDAGLFNHTQFPIVGGSESNNFNDADDGFVEIVASNCGCAGQCVVYTNESQFECLCPNDTMLADDRSSCYRELDVIITEKEPLNFTDNGETFYINGLQFVESSFFMFGLDVSLTVSPKPGSTFPNQDVACAVVFVGRDFQSVLASNPVRIGTGRVHKVATLGNTTEGFGPTTDYVSFLEAPILVTGALLLTNGECFLSSRHLQVNISSESVASPIQVFSIPDQFEDGQVSTSARLIFGEGPSISPITTAPPEVTSNGLIVGLVFLAVIVAMVIIVGLILFLICFRLKSKKKRVSLDLKITSVEELHVRMQYAGALIPKLYSNKEHYKMVFSSILIPYASLTVKDQIGQGAFGVVFRGELRRPGVEKVEDIAIKTIKNSGQEVDIKSFFEESVLMKDFEHSNILSLAGVCFDTPDGVPYILLPFMANGSLKDYLKKNRAHATSVDQLPKDMDDATLVRMCMDIAAGMEYLAGQKFVHRDLAARNCMVDESLMIKVGDFGLARDVYSNDYYRAGKEAMVPVKWMAPETLQDGISNEKTDVWSFGVTCWEVFSLGRVPYPGISNKDVLKHITVEKERLQKPALCPEQLYTLAMSSCWKLLPEDRPTFSELHSALQEYWEEQHAYI